MCEYCEGNKAIISSIKQLEDRTETVVGGIENEKLKISTMVQTAFLINSPAFAETEINFCPMCGRNLATTEE